jgi:succinate dehydrogenase/fumarate reductase flavoprotein subunit
MNPGAIELYKDKDIDITSEPLEIAVCAQHNNGGLAANHWWESENLEHLFPVGEVNGSHGIYRPGGSALNSGQVAGIRAAEYIANRYNENSLETDVATRAAEGALSVLTAWQAACDNAGASWRDEREEFQKRMSRAGAHIRSAGELKKAVREAWEQWDRIENSGCSYSGPHELAEALRNRQLCFTHAVYLEAVLFAVESGVGSRGSAAVVDENGEQVHDKLDESWRILPENQDFREKVMETTATADGRVTNQWIQRRPIPETESWFETAWARFRNGAIYD